MALTLLHRASLSRLGRPLRGHADNVDHLSSSSTTGQKQNMIVPPLFVALSVVSTHDWSMVQWGQKSVMSGKAYSLQKLDWSFCMIAIFHPSHHCPFKLGNTMVER